MLECCCAPADAASGFDRRFVQGKRLGKEITLFSVWYELGHHACLIPTVC
jgi:hypothetical protein